MKRKENKYLELDLMDEEDGEVSKGMGNICRKDRKMLRNRIKAL